MLGHFPKYSFVVQDEVRGLHWNNLQRTLHPVVDYYKDGHALQSVSYCIISDDNKHELGMVYQVQKDIITDLKLFFPNLSHVNYFSEGCASPGV